jgi:hypothetical protein
MPLLTTLTSIARQKSAGASYIIPANSIILYNGTYTSAIGSWDLYAAANNMLIVGTATQGSIATTQVSSGGSNSTLGTMSTGGDHYGNGLNIVGGGGNINGYGYQTLAGGHTHTSWDISSASANSAIKPVHTKFTFLKTSTDTTTFPANTVHISSTSLYTGATQQLAATSDRYIVGSNARTDVAATTHSMTYTASSDTINHSHSGGSLTRVTATVYGTLQNTGSSNQVINGHNHTLTKTVAIDKLKGKLLKLWLSAQSQIPKSSLVLMYSGDLSLLPSYWKVCDGTNGTIDMQGYFLGYATSSATAHDTVTSANTQYTLTDPTATATGSWTHSHFGAIQAYYTSMYAYHSMTDTSHTHGMSGGTIYSNYEPDHFKLAFIQLVP